MLSPYPAGPQHNFVAVSIQKPSSSCNRSMVIEEKGRKIKTVHAAISVRFRRTLHKEIGNSGFVPWSRARNGRCQKRKMSLKNNRQNKQRW